jgi:outer membrane protein TolC
MKRSTAFFLALLAIAAPQSAHGQQAVINLTLADAIARGVEASHRVGELRAREEAARAVEDQRRVGDRPQLALLGGYTRINHVTPFGFRSGADGTSLVLYPDIPDNLQTRIDLQWPVYTAGRTSALVRAAAGEADALGQDRQALEADLRLEITRAYWAVLTARASRDVLVDALKRTDAHLGDVRNQFDVGLVPPSDVLSTEAQHARQEMLRIEADNLLDNAGVDLRRLVGLPPESPFELVDAIRRPPPPPAEVAQSVQTALGTRAERKSLTLRAAAAADRVVAAAAGRWPAFIVAGGYDFAHPNRKIFPVTEEWRQSWEIGINVRWPVFDGGKVQAETAEADGLRRAAEERLKEADTTIDADVRMRIADLRSAEAAIDASEVGVRAATEARRVVTDRFAAGVATNTDVLDAQTALLQAELDRTRALSNAQLSWARLERAMGR